MTLRHRTDSWWEAGQKRRVELGARPDPRLEPRGWDPAFLALLDDPSFQRAYEGDVWIIRGGWQTSDGQAGFYMSYDERRQDWPIIGYGLTCPNEWCDAGVHLWTHASDCPAFLGRSCKNGGPHSCWTWSGDISSGTLTANPSLFANYDACGWHGFLVQGQMRSV